MLLFIKVIVFFQHNKISISIDGLGKEPSEDSKPILCDMKQVNKNDAR